jgi:hypothetical protein
LGRFNFEHGDSKAALELYDRSLRVAPYLYQPYIGLSVLYFKQKDFGLAKESVKRGLVINPASEQLQQLQALLEKP